MAAPKYLNVVNVAHHPLYKELCREVHQREVDAEPIRNAPGLAGFGGVLISRRVVWGETVSRHSIGLRKSRCRSSP
jgi:hypothetical protein